MEQRKKQEGHDHMAKAEKYLETSVWKLKFAPDWDSAADELNKAAVCFRVGQSWPEAKEAHLKAAEAYANNGSLYHAGKQLDQAMNIVRDMGQLEEVEELANRGGLLYRQAGNPESAAQLLVRAAKLLEVSDPARAVSLYLKAADTVGTEDRTQEAGQHMEQAAKLSVRSGQYDKAAEILESTLSCYSQTGSGASGTPYGRVVLAFVLVQEKRGDCVAASKVWSQWGGYCDGYQTSAAHDIISGFSERDGDLVKRGLSSASVKALDNDYVKMARDMDVPQSGAAQDDDDLDLC